MLLMWTDRSPLSSEAIWFSAFEFVICQCVKKKKKKKEKRVRQCGRFSFRKQLINNECNAISTRLFQDSLMKLEKRKSVAFGWLQNMSPTK